MTAPTKGYYETAQECVDKLKAMPFEQGLAEALDLRSDDFGHDCTELLEAESQCFQHFGEQFLERIAKLERVRDAARDAAVAIEATHLSDEYKSVWFCNQLHNGPYDGPSYTVELAALKAALEETKK